MKRTYATTTVALVSLWLLTAGTAACQQQTGEAESAVPQADTMATEASGEWISLTDGQGMAGWRGFRRDDVPGKWQVDDGALHFNPEAEGDGGDLITEETFDDFELELEWKIGACGNSGIMYNVAESDEWANTYDTGPEMQVLDNTCHPDAQNGPDRTAGANYALQAPTQDVTKPAGEWNQARLIINGNHVEHWLNGEKVVEYEMNSDTWKEQVANSKFAEFPGYATAEEGHIALQDHGDPVWFRNVRIRRL